MCTAKLSNGTGAVSVDMEVLMLEAETQHPEVGGGLIL